MDYLALRKDLQDSSLNSNLKDAKGGSGRMLGTSAKAPDSYAKEYSIIPTKTRSRSSSSSSSSSNSTKKGLGGGRKSVTDSFGSSALPPREPLQYSSPASGGYDSFGARPKNGSFGGGGGGDGLSSLEAVKRPGPPTLPKPFPRYNFASGNCSIYYI